MSWTFLYSLGMNIINIIYISLPSLMFKQTDLKNLKGVESVSFFVQLEIKQKKKKYTSRSPFLILKK